MTGPLHGLRVIEIAGIGPAPMGCMWLADLGADVVRVERPDQPGLVEPRFDLLARGRRSLVLDLKQEAGVGALLRLVREADVLVEGFRPGVAERLGFGPQVCHEHNPRLVYGRMTGWGQTGPLSAAAGHDINYLALSGALHAIGRAGGPPVPPLNLVADFAGGALYLVAGILAALYERQHSGRGQVVDAAMVDGVAHLMTFVYGLFGAGLWSDRRGSNLLDSGAPFYDVYATADGEFIAVGALEPRFFDVLAERIGLPDADRQCRSDPRRWPQLRAALAAIFQKKTRQQWCELLEGSDACFAPVLSLTQAPQHPHNLARSTFTQAGEVIQSAPAPRFDRSVPDPVASVPAPGEHSRQVLAQFGFSASEIAALERAGVLGRNP